MYRYFPRSYAYCFKTMLLEPGVVELKEAKGNQHMLEVVLNNFFRQLECWRYDYSSLPHHDDPGIPESEAKEMYETLDAVFKEVFPTQAGLDRGEAAEYMENVTRNVYSEISGKAPDVAGCKQHLLIFMEKMLEALERLAKKPTAEEITA